MISHQTANASVPFDLRLFNRITYCRRKAAYGF